MRVNSADDEGEEADGDAGAEDRQRRAHAGGHGDHAEGEVEVDPGADVGHRGGGHVAESELALLGTRPGPVARAHPGHLYGPPLRDPTPYAMNESPVLAQV